MKVLKREAAMEIKFYNLEALKIVERLEHNGRQFYTKTTVLSIFSYLCQSVKILKIPAICAISCV